jgi:hypothetical protein
MGLLLEGLKMHLSAESDVELLVELLLVQLAVAVVADEQGFLHRCHYPALSRAELLFQPDFARLSVGSCRRTVDFFRVPRPRPHQRGRCNVVLSPDHSWRVELVDPKALTMTGKGIGCEKPSCLIHVSEPSIRHPPF